MKRFFFAAAFALLAFSSAASAQSPDPMPASDVTLAEYYDQWTPRQWRALQSQLLKALRGPVQEVDQTILQNVIYFETHYPAAMELERSAPALLRIYERHDDAQMRVLAISALHTVAEAETMQRLARVIRHEESDMARHVGIAAVADYYRSRQ